MRAALGAIDPTAYNIATRCVVGDCLTRSARTFPDRPALVFEGRTISYLELEQRANGMASWCVEHLEAQQPVAILMRNSDAFVVTYFGCAKAGMVAVPVNLAQNAEDIVYVLSDCGAKVVVTDGEYLGLLAEILPELPEIDHILVLDDACSPSIDGVETLRWADVTTRAINPPSVIVNDRDIVQCLYSSGTTSRPKGVLTAHVSVVVANLTMAITFGHQWGKNHSIMPITPPLFHTNALDALLLPLLATGGTAIIMDGFESLAMLELLRETRVTHLMALPVQYQQLLEVIGPDESFEEVRMCIYAMAPLADRWIERLLRAFPSASVVLGSGMTECVPATVFQWPEHRVTKSGSWGPPTPTCEVAILSEDGDLVGAGGTGEIVYRGPHVMHGYWNNAEANQAAFAHGWLHTGDVGHLDDDGVLWFTDRAKDVVKTGGENVSSVEVEAALLAHPDVMECAVIGLPDDRWGEAVTALVVSADRDEKALIAHCKSVLAPFKVPKRVIFVQELPRTATGKVQKATLRRKLCDAGG